MGNFRALFRGFRRSTADGHAMPEDAEGGGRGGSIRRWRMRRRSDRLGFERLAAVPAMISEVSAPDRYIAVINLVEAIDASEANIPRALPVIEQLAASGNGDALAMFLSLIRKDTAEKLSKAAASNKVLSRVFNTASPAMYM